MAEGGFGSTCFDDLSFGLVWNGGEFLALDEVLIYTQFSFLISRGAAGKV